MTSNAGNRGPSGVDVSPSGSCVAGTLSKRRGRTTPPVHSSPKLLSIPKGLPSRSESGKPSSTRWSSSTTLSSANRMTATTRKRPGDGQLLSRSANVCSAIAHFRISATIPQIASNSPELCALTQATTPRFFSVPRELHSRSPTRAHGPDSRYID